MMRRGLAVLAALMLCAGCAATPAPASAAPQAVSSSAAVSAPAAPDPAPSQSESPAPPAIQIEYPLLVTSLGQSTDGLLVREMLSDLKADFTYETVVPPERLSDYRTVLLAVGASAKALGGLGMTTEAEFDRCKALLAALPPESTVILVRLGDSASQDSLTAALLELALPYADMLLITQNSDRDGALAAFAAEQGIACSVSGSVRQMIEALGALIFPPEPAQ